MAALLYFLSAAGTLLLVRRFVTVSRPVAAALILLPLCLTGRALVTGKVYAPIDLAYHFDPLASIAANVGIQQITNPLPSDVAAQFLPWNAALRWSIAHGQWPLWNPFELSGNVLAAAAQSAPFHPVTLLGLLLPMPDALGFMASMTYFLAALGMFLFLRNLELRSLPALSGAAGWMFSTYVITYTLTAHGNAIVLLPLVMLGARALGRRPGFRSASLLTVALMVLTLCGHPETSLHIVALATVYVLVQTKERWFAVLAGGLGAGIATLLLTAFFLAPMIEAIPQTREYQHRRAGDERVSAPWSAVGHSLVNNFVPFSEGTPGLEELHHEGSVRHRSMGSAYCGAMLMAPALLALLGVRTREKYFFSALFLFGILAGAETPGLTELLNGLPIFSLAINGRMVSFAAFGFCVLAAIGLQASIAARARLAWMYLAIALSIAVVIAWTAVPTTLTPDFVRANAIREVVPLFLAFALLRVLRAHSSAAAGLLGLLLLQRVTEIGGFIPTVDRRAFYPRIEGFEHLPPSAAAPYRIVGQGPLFAPNIGTMYGLQDVRGYQAMTFARLAETFPLWSIPQPVWSNRVDDLSAPMLSLMNVRYALALPDSTVPPMWRLIGRYPGYQLLENGNALPRAFVPRIIHAGTSDAMGGMRTCRDFANDAWIETAGPPSTIKNGDGSVAVRADGSRLMMHASMRTPGWIVVSETAWKGWRATIDGQRLKVHFANRAFIGLYVPAGEHEIELAYRPRAAVLGAIVSLAAALLCAALARWRSQRAPRPPSRASLSSTPASTPSAA